MRSFKFVGDTVHDEPNNPEVVEYFGVKFELGEAVSVSDEIAGKLERHSHFAEVGAAELDSGTGPGSGDEGGQSGEGAVSSGGKNRVSKKKRRGRPPKNVV